MSKRDGWKCRNLSYGKRFLASQTKSPSTLAKLKRKLAPTSGRELFGLYSKRQHLEPTIGSLPRLRRPYLSHRLCSNVRFLIVEEGHRCANTSGSSLSLR